MKRRPPPRGPRPSPRRDWRALGVDRPQRGLTLPVRTGADTAPDAPPGHPLEDVELRVRPGPDGARVVLVAALVFADTDGARRLAARLVEAADAADAHEGTRS